MNPRRQITHNASMARFYILHPKDMCAKKEQ